MGCGFINAELLAEYRTLNAFYYSTFGWQPVAKSQQPA
jgi:hypothetical protein